MQEEVKLTRRQRRQQKKLEDQGNVSSGMMRFNGIKPTTNVLYSALFILLAIVCVIPIVFVIIISFSS